MSKNLLIVFVKNITPGKVKTRLAKAIGNTGAINVYEELLAITESVVASIISDKRIYFSENIIDDKWLKSSKYLQKGADLGEKMQNAFEKGFSDGYEKIVLIGSDLPDISVQIIQEGFHNLDGNDVVFGPAQDGGYYLVGMRKPHFCIFKNKHWSTDNLLKETLVELEQQNVGITLLKTLNDIDTFEDLKASKIYNNEKFHFNIL